MEKKISVCAICYNESFFAPMFLNSCREFADEVCIIDGYSTDGTWEYLQEEAKKETKMKIRLGQHKGANPKTINFGEARQKAYDMTTGDWVFWLDFDEALQDNSRKMLEIVMNSDMDVLVYSMQYIHFVSDFAHIDSSQPIHFGFARFHKRLASVKLNTAINHSLPSSPEFKIAGIRFTPIIFHCGYIRGMEKIFEAYYRNVTRGSFHQPFYQAFWKEWHYNGTYPKKPFDMNEMPKVIKDHFHIGKFDLMDSKKQEDIVNISK